MTVKITDLSYHYPDGTRGLRAVNLELFSGRRTAILGVNGSGKSTLLYHLNGTFLPQQGQVQVLGVQVSKKTVAALRRQVGFLFDYPDHQLFATSVARDVAFGPRNYGFTKSEIGPMVQRALERVEMEALKEKPPYQLSLGQKKRAAIAGVIAMEPQLIVCDEPFSGLDPHAQEQFQRMLDKWVKEGRTMVFSTHDVDFAYSWADDAVLMTEGQVLAHGPVREVLENHQAMGRAKLKPPLLAQLFSHYTHKPRNLEEALDLIREERP